MTESAFSSSAQQAIQRSIVLDTDQTHTQLSVEELSDYYEVEWTANEIISNNYKRVSKHSSLPRYDYALFSDCPPIPR
jgi:hypothetical protein